MIDRILFQTLGKANKISDKGQHFIFNCPRCAQLFNDGVPDNKFNLEVSINKLIKGKRQNKFHCWKCDFKGDVSFLIKKYGNKSSIQSFNQYVKDYQFFYDEEPIKKYSLRLPKEFISIKDADITNSIHKKALEYLLIERNIDLETLNSFNVGFATHGYYKDRIIIPSYNDRNELNYFVGRSFLDNQYEKYRNPNVDKNSIIFNEKFIDWHSPIFLSEGSFEQLSMPINNIALLGKILPDILLEKLVHYNCSVIIALNMDAYGNIKERSNTWNSSANSTISIARKLIEAGLSNVKYLDMPENDLNEIVIKSNKNGIFTLLRDNVKNIPQW